MDSERYPDLEIYLKDTQIHPIVDWIKSQFERVGDETVSEKMAKITVIAGEGEMVIKVLPETGGKRFTALLIEPNFSRWDTDQDFARSAYEQFGKETRCSIGAWDEDQAVEDTFWRISKHGEGTFDWDTGDPD